MRIKRIIYIYRELPVQAKATSWFLICSFLQKGISVITTPIFTRLLTTAEYGQYNVFNSWLGIVTIFVSLNLYAGVHMQGLIKFDKRRYAFTSSLLGLTTTLTLMWVIIYLLFLNFWNRILDLSILQVFSMLAMIWSTSVFSFWANEQRVTYSYKELVIVTVCISIAKPVLSVFFVILAENKVLGRILGLMCVEVLGYSWMYIRQMRAGKVFFSKEFWLYGLKFNLPLVPHYLSQIILSSADRIMIKNIVGDNEAGIYSLAYSLSQIMTLFNTALSQTISPWIYQKIKYKEIKDIASVAYATMKLIAGINLILIVLAPEIVAVFAPKTYHDAIWVIPPVAMSVFFMYCYDLFAKIAFYYEKTQFIMVASVIGAVLNVILNYIFIKQFGYIAAGYTTFICYVIYSFAHYQFMKKVCDKNCTGDYPYDSFKIIRIAVIFVLLGVVLAFTYRYRFFRYGVIAVTFIEIIMMRRNIGKALRNILLLCNTKDKNNG